MSESGRVFLVIFRFQATNERFSHEDFLESNEEGVHWIELVKLYLESCFTDLESAHERIPTGFLVTFQVLGL